MVAAASLGAGGETGSICGSRMLEFTQFSFWWLDAVSASLYSTPFLESLTGFEPSKTQISACLGLE